MSDLTEFLLARIAEDEAVARSATGGDRTGNWWEDPEEGGVVEVSCLAVQGFITAVSADAAFLVTNDPARVLADCEAKRRIVERHSGRHHCAHGRGADDEFPCRDSRDLAAVYSDHPDFQESWRV